MLIALKKGQNALLEAPTGCGKTLSLLCAALAWQEARRAEMTAQQLQVPARIVLPKLCRRPWRTGVPACGCYVSGLLCQIDVANVLKTFPRDLVNCLRSVWR